MQRRRSNSGESGSADHRVRVYTLAAAAAGVSMLAMSLPAEGSVVVTRKNIAIPLNGTVSVDLNKDGLADFEFSLTSSFVNSKRHDNLTAKGLTGGKMVGGKLKPSSAPYGNPYASALARGKKIGPSAHFSSAHGKITIERQVHAESAGTYYGNWYAIGPDHFLGVKFQIKGQTHFGWIRLTVETGAFTATITEFSYETVANKTVEVGLSSSSAGAKSTEAHSRGSLGMLALGAEGLALWKQRDIC